MVDLTFEKFMNQAESIKTGELVAIIATLPKIFEIKFDFKPTRWNNNDYTSLIHFNDKHKKNHGWGSRIPAVFVNEQKLSISFGVDGEYNWHIKSARLFLHKWHTTKITQIYKSGVYLSKIYHDGVLLSSKPNSKAKEFHDVQIWAGDDFYEAQAGVIRSLSVSGKIMILFSVFLFHF